MDMFATPLPSSCACVPGVHVLQVIDRLGIKTLPAWNVSLIVHDVHKSYHRADSGGECVAVDCDCSHACSPSWYQMLLAGLSAALRQEELGLASV